MIADLHCHYPMRMLEHVRPTTTYDRLRARNQVGWREKLRAAVFRFAARNFNHPGAECPEDDPGACWRVSFDGLDAGRCRLVLSVLYDPVAEIDLDEHPSDSPPDRDYFDKLETYLGDVVTRLAADDRGRGRYVVVKSIADLDAAADRMAFVHCIEGGFHLGRASGAPPIDEKVRRLAEAGVAYITVAHLIFRGIATSANAFPGVADRVYRTIHCQGRRGLTDKGVEVLTAMHRHRVIPDLSHMREDAFYETLGLLDRLDDEDRRAGRLGPGESTPVMASHSGYRFGGLDYMLDDEMVRRIAARDGVIGLILARHQLQHGDGIPDGEGAAHTAAVVKKHAEKIAGITKSWRHVAIGSDLDGFIEPTMGGVEKAQDLADLEDELRAAMPERADAVLYGNAERVIRRAFELRA